MYNANSQGNCHIRVCITNFKNQLANIATLVYLQMIREVVREYCHIRVDVANSRISSRILPHQYRCKLFANQFADITTCVTKFANQLANITTLVIGNIRELVGEYCYISIHVVIKYREAVREYRHIYTAVTCQRILPDITWRYSTQLLRTCVIPGTWLYMSNCYLVLCEIHVVDRFSGW